MNKCSFYTMIRKNNKIQAHLIINGYSDGNYYYYKQYGNLWSVIHPLCGLSIATGKTREAARQMAYSLPVQDGLNRIYENKTYYKKICSEFENHILKLKQEARKNEIL